MIYNYSSLFKSNKNIVNLFCNILKRFKYKQKWASTRPKKTPRILALEHFDIYHKPIFGDRWPSIRIALLSKSKHCAILNNFCDDQSESILDLAAIGAFDFIEFCKSTELNGTFSLLKQSQLESTGKNNLEINRVESVVTADGDDQQSSVLSDFMPVKRIITEGDEMMLEDMKQNIYRPKAMDLEILPHAPLNVPHQLKALTFVRGDVCIFPPAKRETASGKLTYYLMDAASVLPVLALGLEPGCSVLDLCAAPGGKSLLMLQTGLPDNITCVDHSYSRIKRLKDIMRLYFPRVYMEEQKIKIVHNDGTQFSSNEKYDRVLVDVPCYADRHVLAEDENNIFRPSRMEDRLQIQETQRRLLFVGIQSCKPGGIVVYSTCTLSPAQNDGTIQATLEKIWQETKMEVAIEDTGTIAETFQETFDFLKKCRFGQLVVPNLTANFGPMYFCKLRRLK